MRSFILAYHRVGDDAGDPLVVSAGALERQIGTLLSHDFRPVRLEEAVDLRLAQTATRSFAVTFDDGYRDTLIQALPVLDRLHISATVFVVPAFADEAGRRSAMNDVSDFMTWDQIRQLKAAGHEVGSHTQNHRFLGAEPAEVVQHELVQSRIRIEDELRSPVTSFCYPGGNIRPDTPSSVKDAGYDHAVLTASAPAPPEDRFTVRRVGIYGHTSQTLFRVKVRRPFRDWVESGALKSFTKS